MIRNYCRIIEIDGDMVKVAICDPKKPYKPNTPDDPVHLAYRKNASRKHSIGESGYLEYVDLGPHLADENKTARRHIRVEFVPAHLPQDTVRRNVSEQIRKLFPDKYPCDNPPPSFDKAPKTISTDKIKTVKRPNPFTQQTRKLPAPETEIEEADIYDDYSEEW